MAEAGISPVTTASSTEAFEVRSFQPADRPQVLQLHAAVAADSVECDCAVNIDQIEQTYFSRPEDHFWVAEVQGRIVGTVALSVQDQDVAHLHCLRAANDSEDRIIRKDLVRVAASHARHHGCLKLVIHARADAARAAEFLHRLGFEFSRQRESDKQPVLEFYLNLYQPPELQPPKEAAPHYLGTDKSP